MRVRVFGVVVASDLPLPGSPVPAAARTFLRIRVGKKGKEKVGRWRTVARDPAGRPWMLLARAGERRVLRVPSIGRFSLSADGREIRACAENGVSPGLFLRTLLDHVLPRALHVAGIPVLHASAVAGPRGALVFLGESGAGKTTLAARHAINGWPLLADDGVRLEVKGGRVLAHPSHPLLRVREDILRALPARIRAAAAPGDGKWILDARNRPLRFAGKPVPVHRIHLLGPGPEMRRPMSAREALLTLLDGTFRADPWDIEAFESDLRFLADVVGCVPVSRHGLRD